MRTMLIVAGLVVVTAIGLITINGSTNNSTSNMVKEPTVGVVLSEENTIPAEVEPALKNEGHPHSLQSIIDMELDGSDFSIGQVLSTTASYTRYFITYLSEERTVSGIMNVPKGEGPFPVLFLNHGFIDPSVYTNGRGLKREQDFFARNGYVVVHSDYRGHAQSDPFREDEQGQRFGYNGYTIDVLNAIIALRKADLLYADTEQVGLLGHSMGGGITQNILVTYPELLDAAVLYAPVSTNYQDNFFKWRSRNFSEEQLNDTQARFGDFNDLETFAAFSSRTYADRIEDPIQIYHGTADDSVPIDWSRTTLDTFIEQGINIELIEFPGEAHEFGPRWSDFMNGSLEFFNELLK